MGEGNRSPWAFGDSHTTPSRAGNRPAHPDAQPGALKLCSVMAPLARGQEPKGYVMRRRGGRFPSPSSLTWPLQVSGRNAAALGLGSTWHHAPFICNAAKASDPSACTQTGTAWHPGNSSLGGHCCTVGESSQWTHRRTPTGRTTPPPTLGCSPARKGLERSPQCCPLQSGRGGNVTDKRGITAPLSPADPAQ